eukprot:12120211-Alexandrium_andersonii.AAC.1
MAGLRLLQPLGRAFLATPRRPSCDASGVPTDCRVARPRRGAYAGLSRAALEMSRRRQAAR